MLAQLALPDHVNRPPEPAKVGFVSTISLDIGRKLLFPEFLPGGGRCRVPASRVSMPEASVHKHHGSIPGKHQIGSTGQATSPEAVTEPPGVEAPPDQHLGAGVTTPDARHHAASNGGRDDVSQLFGSPSRAGCRHGHASDPRCRATSPWRSRR